MWTVLAQGQVVTFFPRLLCLFLSVLIEKERVPIRQLKGVFKCLLLPFATEDQLRRAVGSWGNPPSELQGSVQHWYAGRLFKNSCAAQFINDAFYLEYVHLYRIIILFVIAINYFPCSLVWKICDDTSMFFSPLVSASLLNPAPPFLQAKLWLCRMSPPWRRVTQQM